MRSTVTPGRDIVVVGDVVLDRDVVGHADRLCPDAPAPVVDVERVCTGPGGAGLAAVLCARRGARVTLVAPIADDSRGTELRRLLAAEGVRVIALGHTGPTRCKTRVRAEDHSLTRFDEGGPGTPGELPGEAADHLRRADAVLVSDYGAGMTAQPAVRAVLERRCREERILVWDPHPHGAVPVAGATLVTPNLAEATAALATSTSSDVSSTDGARLAAALMRRWSATAMCVTCGEKGAWLATSSPEPYFAPAPDIAATDPCGAGDCLSATITLALASGATPPEAVDHGVQEASRWVAQGGTTGFRERTDPPPVRDDGRRPEHRPFGGTLVATGGCFDVLHAGHLASLEAARRLGDSLVVMLNSDSSVRRRKGPGRPVQSVADRARLLRALSVVDDVVIFDEDDPREALRRLRPDVWAKGGDYDANSLPEAEVVQSWGGRVVLLPYLNGHSTTSLLDQHQERKLHDNFR